MRDPFATADEDVIHLQLTWRQWMQEIEVQHRLLPQQAVGHFEIVDAVVDDLIRAARRGGAESQHL